MADTYYAWSNFKVEHNKEGQVTKWIRCGETVSQSDLSVSDEDWQELINVGAVRTQEYPPVPSSVAPAEYFKVDNEKRVLLEEASNIEVVGTAAPGLTAPTTLLTEEEQAAADAAAAQAEADAQKQQGTGIFKQNK